jgi:hypothetical protein
MRRLRWTRRRQTTSRAPISLQQQKCQLRLRIQHNIPVRRTQSYLSHPRWLGRPARSERFRISRLTYLLRLADNKARRLICDSNQLGHGNAIDFEVLFADPDAR